MKLSRLSPSDYEEAVSFWKHAEGMGTCGVETKVVLASFLKRNPGLSFKVTDRDQIVGTVLCGHDGRRGYLHHIAVAPGYTERKVGKTLVDRTLSGLEQLGIERCHIFISAGNTNGREFWKSIDWNEQGDLTIYTHDLEYPSV